MTASDAEIARLARRQHHCFSRTQAAEVGFSAKQMRHRMTSGVWLAPHRDVFMIAGAAPTLRSRAMAATLALPGSAAALATAMQLRNEGDLPEGLIHVLRQHGRSHRLGGVRLHQTRRLPSHHVTSIEGIPITTRARTLFDLGARVDPRRLGRLVDDGIRSRRVAIDDIGAVFAELAHPRRPGSKTMATVLDRRAGSPVDMSELERRFHELLHRFGVAVGIAEYPAPWRPMWPGHAARVDMAYVEEHVVVELDGRSYHTRLEQFENDRRRDQFAVASGWVPVRFAWSQVVGEPAHVERILRTTLERQRALWGLSSAPRDVA